MERKIRPAEFEIRANQFIHHVRGIPMRIYRGRNPLELIVEKPMPKLANSFAKLAEINDNPMKNFINGLGDNLDQQTPDRCVVMVDATCWDGSRILEPFIKEVYALSKQFKCEPTEFILPTTGDEDSEITVFHVGPAVWRRFFNFS